MDNILVECVSLNLNCIVIKPNVHSVKADKVSLSINFREKKNQMYTALGLIKFLSVLTVEKRKLNVHSVKDDKVSLSLSCRERKNQMYAALRLIKFISV
jgi:hypothetical protein